jgi:catechol 2,3-dioxygenase-like lactoylglutathione lyase family enzyme
MPSAKEYHCGNAIYKVPDLPSAKLFYSTAFGAEAWFEEPAWVIFQIHEQQLWIVPVDSTEEHPEALGFSSGQGGITYWIVDDVSFVYRRFAELGGIAHEISKTDAPFKDAIVEDPWGNKLGLVSRPYGKR